jgi:hypothetical protein
LTYHFFHEPLLWHPAPTYGTKCGYFSNVENCRPATACVVDMYIDDKANLPWNNKARYASMYGRKSKGVLRSQYPVSFV